MVWFVIYVIKYELLMDQKSNNKDIGLTNNKECTTRGFYLSFNVLEVFVWCYEFIQVDQIDTKLVQEEVERGWFFNQLDQPGVMA